MDFTPSLDDFCAGYEEGRAQLVYTRLIADLDTPVSLFAKLAEGEKNACILESVVGGENRARYSIIGLRPDLIFRIEKERAAINRAALYSDEFEALPGKPLEELSRLIDEAQINDFPPDLPAPAAGLFGYLGYDVIRQVEKIGKLNPDPIKTPDAIFVRPTIVLIVDSVKHEVILVTPVRPRGDMKARAAYEIAAERLRSAVDQIKGARRAALPLPMGRKEEDAGEGKKRANMEKGQFLDMVMRAKEHIRAGDIFQIVLSMRWAVNFALPPFAFYRALRRTNPSPYMFYFNFGGFQCIGASPEILVNVTGSKVTIRPLAGTRPRGKTAEEDKALEVELLADKKERAEHLMLLDLGRNDVGRVSEIGSVSPSEVFTVERYSHVMHIVSNVIGTLKKGKSALDALLAGLPAGTLSGAPKIRAMQLIDALEGEKRGVYGGGVGYFSSNGDMDICIALRTAVLKEGALYVQAGAGIVLDSDPESEFCECAHKAEALFSAARDARLFAEREGN